MITAFVLVGFAVLALTLILLAAARGRSAAVENVTGLQGRTQAVDLLAFRNLVDPHEEEYLREKLSPREFRVIQRERLRTALAYVNCVGANAAVVLRLGEAAQRSPDPEVATAGQELVNSALWLRVYVLYAAVKLSTGMLIPGLRFRSTRVCDAYENLTGIVGRLGRLQHYPQTAKILATL
jgi:hypothetical protein